MGIKVIGLNKALRINNITVDNFIDIGLGGKCGVNINLYWHIPANTSIYSMSSQPSFGDTGDDLAVNRAFERIESNVRLLKLSKSDINNLRLYKKTTQHTFDSGLAEYIDEKCSISTLVEALPGEGRVYGFYSKDLNALIRQNTAVKLIKGRIVIKKPTTPVDIDILSDQLFIEPCSIKAVSEYVNDDDIYQQVKNRFKFMATLDKGCRFFAQPQNKFTASNAEDFLIKKGISRTYAERLTKILNIKSRRVTDPGNEVANGIIKDNPHLTLPAALIAAICIKIIKKEIVQKDTVIALEAKKLGLVAVRVPEIIASQLKDS